MLKTRILTALVIAPIALAGLFALPAAEFRWFILLILAVCGWEWGNFCRFSPTSRWIYGILIATVFYLSSSYTNLWLVIAAISWGLALLLILRYPSQSDVWRLPATQSVIGFMILVPAGTSLLALKYSQLGNQWILLLLVLIWSADIGAYFVGRRFGQRKLLPAVSPGKSMMGLLGGLITAMLLGAMAIGVMIDDELREAPLFWLSMFLMVALISVLGDLTVSMLKRNRGIKDSSGLLSGHGGSLDRLDSLFSAAPFFCGLLMLSGRLV